MKIEERNRPFFEKNSLEETKRVILSPIFDQNFRWKVETVSVYEKLSHFIKPGFRVLDFGIGIGRISKIILERLSSVKIVGVDSTPRMLEYARQYIPKRFFSADRIQLFSLEEFFNLDHNSFDLVIAVYVLQHVSSNCFDKILEKINRCLKENGFLFVLNWKTRLAIDPYTLEYYNDKLDVKQKLNKLFPEHEKIVFADPLMSKVITKTNFCEVYHKRSPSGK